MALGKSNAPSAFVARITKLPQTPEEASLYTVQPIAEGYYPAHPGPILPGDPGWGPPYPEPPPTMPEPTMDWVYAADGWYFIAGPYDKPKPICPTANLAVVDLPKAKWTTAGQGWYFVFGPFDKPRALCGVEPPDTEPPTEPPVSEGCKWTYTSAGWVLCCGPYDKPKPPTP